jgi:hypothetical protein
LDKRVTVVSNAIRLRQGILQMGLCSTTTRVLGRVSGTGPQALGNTTMNQFHRFQPIGLRPLMNQQVLLLKLLTSVNSFGIVNGLLYLSSNNTLYFVQFGYNTAFLIPANYFQHILKLCAIRNQQLRKCRKCKLLFLS